MSDPSECFGDLPTNGHYVYRLSARIPGVDPEWHMQTVYIGVTSNLRRRMREHSRRWWWAAVDYDLSEFVDYPTRAAANAAELREIDADQPPINRAGRQLVGPGEGTRRHS